jgi:hypothetical protein
MERTVREDGVNREKTRKKENVDWEKITREHR